MMCCVPFRDLRVPVGWFVAATVAAAGTAVGITVAVHDSATDVTVSWADGTAAVATAVAALAAVAAGIYAVRTFRATKAAATDQLRLLDSQLREQRSANARQHELLQNQLADQQLANADQKTTNAAQRAALDAERAERAVDAERRARDQAARFVFESVSSWTTVDGDLEVTKPIRNESDWPIYHVNLEAHSGLVPPYRSAPLPTLMPHERARIKIQFRGVPIPDPARLRYFAEFFDVDNVRWRVSATGRLDSQQPGETNWTIRRRAFGDDPSQPVLPFNV